MRGYSSAETSSPDPKGRTHQPRAEPPRLLQLHRSPPKRRTRSGRSYTMPRAFPLPLPYIIRYSSRLSLPDLGIHHRSDAFETLVTRSHGPNAHWRGLGHHLPPSVSPHRSIFFPIAFSHSTSAHLSRPCASPGLAARSGGERRSTESSPSSGTIFRSLPAPAPTKPLC